MRERIRLLGSLLRLVLGDTATGTADLLGAVLGLLDLLARGLRLLLQGQDTRREQKGTVLSHTLRYLRSELSNWDGSSLAASCLQ